ncbi:MAG: ribonuclease R [Alphaproteobacteria bacterium]
MVPAAPPPHPGPLPLEGERGKGGVLTVAKGTRRPPPLPTRDQLREYIRDTPGPLHKRDIARAFQVSGEDRVTLKRMLRELESEGDIQRVGHKRTYGHPGLLPSVAVVEITGTDTDGELLARPLVWREEGKPPRIVMAPGRGRGQPAIGVGDRVLARLHQVAEGFYEGRTIRRIAAGKTRVVGVYETAPDGGRIRPTDRRERDDYMVLPVDAGTAASGDLVVAEVLPGRHFGMRTARVAERLGGMDEPRSISLVAIHTHGIPNEFPSSALAQAADAGAAPLGDREDLRPLPLVTIDGEDARDFDDAVWAEADTDPANEGGWTVIVAIADVAWYVRPGDALDRSARERGNSVYFPDRVVPMLPEALSNGWCSLKPDEDRPCLAVRLRIDRTGEKLGHRFVRGMMRSAARLTYSAVQAAHDGIGGDLVPALVAPALVEKVIHPLYGAWRALSQWRARRGTLELDLPERRVVLADDGSVARVEPRARYDSHRLIEEFMIAANVAAAEELESRGQPCMYRIHDEPSLDKLDALREFLASVGLKLSKGQVLEGRHFNQILAKAAGTPNAHVVNEVVLRSQAQAEYAPANIGHFGLGLRRYAHFTSPIRRYADLMVHRALVSGLRLGEGGLPPDAAAEFADVGSHISSTERRAAAAERDSVNRYAAAYLAANVGATFAGRINGVTRFGLFVTLHETGADGIVPVGSLGDDYFVHDATRHTLVGQRSSRTYRLGDAVTVVLMEADPITGSLVFAIEGVKGRRPKVHKRPPPSRGRALCLRETDTPSFTRLSRTRRLRR